LNWSALLIYFVINYCLTYSIFSIFYENQNKLENLNNSIRNEQTSDNNLKTKNIGFSESCNNSTSVVEPPVSLINSTSHNHQYNKVILYFLISKMCKH